MINGLEALFSLSTAYIYTHTQLPVLDSFFLFILDRPYTKKDNYVSFVAVGIATSELSCH